MSPLPADVLRQANEYIQSGQPQLAQPLLAAFVRQNPASDQGWYLLSFIVSDLRQQIDCLQRALKLNPSNANAQARLAQLLEPAPKAAASPAWLSAIQSSRRDVSPVSESSRREPERVESTQRVEPTPRAEPTPPASASDEPVASPEVETGSPEPEPEPESESAPKKKRGVFGKRRAKPEEPSAQNIDLNRQEFADRAAPVARRSRSKRGLVLGLLLLLIVIGGGGAILLSRSNQAALEPATVAVVPTSTVTSTATPSLTPTPPVLTWTPTPTPTPMPTRTPTEIPTVSTSVAGLMNVLQGRVAALRGLDAQADFGRNLIQSGEVERTLKSLVSPQDYLSDLPDQTRSLAVLGLVKPSYDLTKFRLNQLIDNAGGSYLPWLKQILVLSDGFSRGVAHLAFVREFDRALLDQHYKIDRLNIYPGCGDDAQRCAAIRALIEGDAALLGSQWLAQASPEDQFDIQRFEPPIEMLPEIAPSAYVTRELSFPRTAGLAFVQYLYDHGKWPAVNRVYANLPQSTEQILHPEKYLAGEKPLAVATPPLTDSLGAGWRLIDDNVLGEWTTYLILNSGVDPAARLPDDVAARAAQGWRGDHYRVYVNDAISQTILIAQWAWDTQGDADEFKVAMSSYLALRFAGSKSDRSDNPCIDTGTEMTCLFTQGPKSLWLIAPDRSMLDKIQAAFTDFKDIK